MRVRLLLLVWLSSLAGCSFAPGDAAIDALGSRDASIDAPKSHDAAHADATRPDAAPPDAAPPDAAPPDAAMPQLCFDASDVSLKVCLATAPTGSTTLVTTAFNTSNPGGACAALGSNSDAACAVAGSDVTIPAGVLLSASGDAPLVIIATGEIDVSGTIDVASHRTAPDAGQVGPMANPAGCGGTVPTVDSSGGGAGGSYSTVGGNGGGGFPSGSQGRAGAALSIALHGGCQGQTGNSTGQGAIGGAGGNGGGVVVLIAPTILIEASGIIDASGEGGDLAGSGNTRGGGGGGAGGLIFLKANAITADAGAQIFANGGGGGGGTSTSPGDTAGTDPTDANATPAGGSPSGNAGAGGNGFFVGSNGTANQATAGANEGEPSDGGGGGGGGAGFIHVPTGGTVAGSGAFSPAVTQ